MRGVCGATGSISWLGLGTTRDLPLRAVTTPFIQLHYPYTLSLCERGNKNKYTASQLHVLVLCLHGRVQAYFRPGAWSVLTTLSTHLFLLSVDVEPWRQISCAPVQRGAETCVCLSCFYVDDILCCFRVWAHNSRLVPTARRSWVISHTVSAGNFN